MLDLKTALLQFKDDTVALINCLEADDFDSLEGLLNMRQTLIDTLDSSSYDKKLFVNLCKEYDIIKLNSKMNTMMTEKINSIKSEIKKIELQKNINSNYTVSTAVDSIFFNKKI